MNTMLFDIQTQVKVDGKMGRKETVHYVSIIAAPPTREKIWKIISSRRFNPGVAQYEGGIPTNIGLEPYPGYHGTDVVAQMAYAAACLATVEDFEILFHRRIDEILTDPPQFNRQINFASLMSFQKLYLADRAINTLLAAFSASNTVVNAAALVSWQTEAEEARRRLTFAEKSGGKLILVTTDLDVLSQIASEAKSLKNTQVTAREQLGNELDALVKELDSWAASGDVWIPEAHYYKYARLLTKIANERTRVKREIDDFAPRFTKAEELMALIRANTPPAPPAQRK